MNKTIKALLLGYIKFRVNEKAFYRYNTAQKYCNKLKKSNCTIVFKGFNPFLWVKDTILPRKYYIEELDLPLFYPKGERGFFEKCYIEELDSPFVYPKGKRFFPKITTFVQK